MLKRPFSSRRADLTIKPMRPPFLLQAIRKICILLITFILWAGANGACEVNRAYSFEKIPEPTAPTAPIAPTKPTLERSRLPDKSQPAPAAEPQEKKLLPNKPELRKTQPTQAETPPKKNEEKAAAPTDNPPPLRQNAVSPPPILESSDKEKIHRAENIIEPETDSDADIFGKSAAPAPDWINKLLYNLLFIIPAAAAVYIFFRNENKTAKPPDAKEDKPLPEISAHIKNASLLEQLIKFDMETHGKLRPGLDYEHPKLVEKLIIKYGRGDKAKIERAIQSFYKNRTKK